MGGAKHEVKRKFYGFERKIPSRPLKIRGIAAGRLPVKHIPAESRATFVLKELGRFYDQTHGVERKGAWV